MIWKKATIPFLVVNHIVITEEKFFLLGILKILAL